FTVVTPSGTSAPFNGFTVTAPVLVTNVTLTPDAAAPQPPGTTIHWTATATGGVAPYQYKWWQFDGVAWTMLADWSTNNVLAWTPVVINANYRIGVWVRSSGNSNDAAEFPQSAAFAILN